MGGCPWRSVGGGKGRALPRGHHLLPRQLLALAALGSVWKAVLRDLRGGGLLGTLVRRWEAPAGRTISACSWLQGPSRPRAGAWGASRSAPIRGQGGGEERSGVPKENPAPSGVLEKLSLKDTQAWMCGSREGSSETRSGCQGRGKIPRPCWRAIPEGGHTRWEAVGRASWGRGPIAPPGPKAGRRRLGLGASRPRPGSPQSHCPAPPPSQRGGLGWRARWASYEDLGQGVGACAGNEGLAGVAGDCMDGLLMLLAVGRDLLDTRLVVQAPQTQRAVVAS